MAFTLVGALGGCSLEKPPLSREIVAHAVQRHDFNLTTARAAGPGGKIREYADGAIHGGSRQLSPLIRAEQSAIFLLDSSPPPHSVLLWRKLARKTVLVFLPMTIHGVTALLIALFRR